MFDRRRAGHRVRLDRERPRIAAGGAAVAGFAVAVGLAVPGWQVPGALFAVLAVIVTIGRLTVLPQSVQAWETGADGERRTADALAPLAARGFAILHDRLIPGSPANIDHIVVGPTGVHVVESKRSGGRVEVRSGDLFVRGRRRTAWIDQVEREAGAVSAALGGAPVGRLICVHGADLPLFSRPTIRGVRIVDARGLVRALTEGSTTLTPADVERSGALCATRLLPAGAVRDEAASADR